MYKFLFNWAVYRSTQVDPPQAFRNTLPRLPNHDLLKMVIWINSARRHIQLWEFSMFLYWHHFSSFVTIMEKKNLLSLPAYAGQSTGRQQKAMFFSLACFTSFRGYAKRFLFKYRKSYILGASNILRLIFSANSRVVCHPHRPQVADRAECILQFENYYWWAWLITFKQCSQA